EAVGRRLAALEHLGDLAGAEAEDIPQHEHGSLLRREMLKTNDECQGYRLLGLVAGLRSGSFVRDSIEEHVGIGLEPDRLAPACLAGGAGSHASRPASGW